MPAVPHSVDIVVRDLGRALAFYRALGLSIPKEGNQEQQVEVTPPPGGGYAFSFVREDLVRSAMPDWQDPVGQRVTLAFRCDDPAEVNPLYASMVAAGHTGRREPWDAFWGQRYAFLSDADGNRVDLLAPLGPE